MPRSGPDAGRRPATGGPDTIAAMYQPGHGRFVVDDAAALLGRLSASFPATLVTTSLDGGLHTSILPMLFNSEAGDHGVLYGHLARPNEQWHDARPGAEAVAIFNGNDAYVSPSFYEEKRRTGRVVPTWNYSTVVAHGVLIAHDDRDWLLRHVRKLVDAHEHNRPDPWSIDDAPEAYIAGQAKGIVGLELVIGRIDAKRKLTQNRSAADYRGTIDGLSATGPRERAVADDMREGLDNDCASASSGARTIAPERTAPQLC